MDYQRNILARVDPLELIYVRYESSDLDELTR